MFLKFTNNFAGKLSVFWYTVPDSLTLRFLRKFQKLTAKTVLNSEICHNVTILRV